MQSFVNVRSMSRICAIVVLFILVVAVPASAITPPTIDSVTPSTTSVVNGGTAIITVSGNCGAQITYAKFEMKNPQGVNTIGGFFDTTTNGNQWNGKSSYTFSQSLQSGQYKIWRISVQDSAGNFVSKELVPEVVINVDNSVTVQPPTINSVTPSTTSVVNGGTAIIMVSGNCGTQITNAKFEMKNPQGVNTIAGFFDTTTNGNQWSGQISYTFSQSLQSGQYKIWRITVQDSAGNFVSKEVVPEIVINVDNSEKFTPSTTIQTISPTTIPTITSLTTSITTTLSISPTTIIATTVVPITLHTTAITTTATLIPTTGQTTVVTTLPTTSQTTSLTIAPTPTIPSTPTSSVEKLLEEQNKKLEEQNRLMAEQNKKMSEQNDLLTQILNYFKGIFGWK